jgi:hypothetical protein
VLPLGMGHVLHSHHLRTAVATVSLSLLVLAGTACGSDDDSSVETSAPTVAGTEAPTTDAPTTQAPTTEAPVSDLTQDEATLIAEEVVAAWNADDVTPIEEILGPTGVWIAITGEQFDATTVAGWLDPILAAIGDSEITGDPVAVANGFSFPIVDVDSGDPFFLVITHDPDSVLTIEETKVAPVAAG